MAFAHFQVIAEPCERILDVLKVEQVAEELERRLLCEQTQAESAPEMPFEQDRDLLQVRKHPRVAGSVFFRPAGHCLHFEWLEREAPVKVDATETGTLVQVREAINR